MASTFGKLKEPIYQNEYIYLKKGKNLFCNTNCCNKLSTVVSYNSKNLFNNIQKYYSNINSIDQQNLVSGQYSVIDLSGVCTVIQGSPCVPVYDCSSCDVPCPINVTTATKPFYFTNTIDPKGLLFGNTQCGELNWTLYKQLSQQLIPRISIYVTGKYTITSNSDYNTIITFTGNGVFTITSQNISIPINYIVVGGGGGGGGGNIGGSPGGGGGGGGGVSLPSFFSSNSQSYNIIVGSGGLGGASQTDTSLSQNGLNGSNSEINGVITINGGQGGFAASNLGTGGTSGNGGAGGSGGIAFTTPGGNGVNGGGGGGGGYGMPGGNGSTTNVSTYLYGTSFGAGGGGNGPLSTNGIAGNIYAGNGGGINAVANYGGGGGGGRSGNSDPGTYGPGGNGGSGIVILFFNR